MQITSSLQYSGKIYPALLTLLSARIESIQDNELTKPLCERRGVLYIYTVGVGGVSGVIPVFVSL